MKNNDGKITLPGFYDSVIPIDAKEKEEFTRLPLSDAYYQEQSGTKSLWGRLDIRP